MRCRKGRHEWADMRDAWRCCSETWRREVRIRGTEHDLDPHGRQTVRVGPYIIIYGWVKVHAPAGRRDVP